MDRHEIVFMGEGVGKGGTMVLYFGAVVDGRVSDTFSIRKGNKHNGLNTGSVYSVEMDDSSIKMDTARWVRRWHDESEIALWQTTEKANKVARMAEKKAKSVGGLLALRQFLRPLRDEYKRTNSEGRIAIEMIVLQCLRGGID